MKKKNWIVVALCVAIVGMGIGFAALAQNLEINATANITGEWDVRVVNVSATTYIPGVLWDHTDDSWKGTTFVGTPTFDGTSATFEIDFEYPGAVAYLAVTVVNFGNIPAILNSVTGVTAANNVAPSEIEISYITLHASGTTSYANVDRIGFHPYELCLGCGDNIIVRAEWVANTYGESIIPDEKTKTFTLNFNYVQNT